MVATALQRTYRMLAEKAIWPDEPAEEQNGRPQVHDILNSLQKLFPGDFKNNASEHRDLMFNSYLRLQNLDTSLLTTNADLSLLSTATFSEPSPEMYQSVAVEDANTPFNLDAPLGTQPIQDGEIVPSEATIAPAPLIEIAYLVISTRPSTGYEPWELSPECFGDEKMLRQLIEELPKPPGLTEEVTGLRFQLIVNSAEPPQPSWTVRKFNEKGFARAKRGLWSQIEVLRVKAVEDATALKLEMEIEFLYDAV
jgi:hypothetical protein